MAMTLTSLLARMRAALMDGGSVTWTDADLTEAARLALAEYNLAGSSAVTIAGLDGAGVTTVAAAHESVMVVGAAGYAAQARAVEALERLQIAPGSAETMQAWGTARLADFRGWLKLLYPAYSAGAGLEAAQESLLAAQAALATGQESRAAAAAAQAAADRAAEAARKTELRETTHPAWGTFPAGGGIEYGEGYDRE